MSPEIIRLFSDTENIVKLPGGQGESVRAGDIAIKPVYEKEKYLWYAGVFEALDFSDIQYSHPIKSKNGNYIENSFCTTRFIEGNFYNGRLREKLEAAQRFNAIIKNIQKPCEFDSWVDPWTQAQAVAWSKNELPGDLDPSIKRRILELDAYKKNINFESQLVHCDYAGNILFNDQGPIIIDFSPGFYPADYSLVCLITDSIAWFGASIKELHLLEIEKNLKCQLVLRAVIFRILVPLFFNPGDAHSFENEYRGYIPVIQWLKRNQ